MWEETLRKGGKDIRIVYIDETPNRLSIFELGKVLSLLAEAPPSREKLQTMEEILRKDERFEDIAADMRRMRGTFFREHSDMLFTPEEGRTILNRIREWEDAIKRRLGVD